MSEAVLSDGFLSNWVCLIFNDQRTKSKTDRRHLFLEDLLLFAIDVETLAGMLMSCLIMSDYNSLLHWSLALNLS